MSAARLLAHCINERDLDALTSRCTEHVEFDTQSLLEPIFGRESLQRYVGTEIALADSRLRPLRAVLGLIDAERSNQPGIILLEADDVRAFWAPSLSASGAISRIFGYTIVPPPHTARRLERLPDALQPGSRLAQFRAAAGPIVFHGFAASAAAAESWLGPRLAKLEARFPGSESRVHVHEEIVTEQAIRTATRERRHFGIVSYPAICVERSGVVFRDGHATQSVEAIAADVAAMLADTSRSGA